jgi:hypothetical protein
MTPATASCGGLPHRSSPRQVVGTARERVGPPPRPRLQAEREDAGFGVAATDRDGAVGFTGPAAGRKTLNGTATRHRVASRSFSSPSADSLRVQLAFIFKTSLRASSVYMLCSEKVYFTP